MCGIAGIFGLTAAARVDPSEILRMVEQLRHRGPNAEGHFVEPSVGLGHTRLSILDLRPESNQPFHSADHRYVIVYNGEIFNYVELRVQLEKLGHVFRTESDTEVLLYAYVAWGEDVCRHLNGMWAFVIYDREEQKLFCSRDRFGIKPFVYANVRGRFLFASEAKALLAVDRSLAEPNFSSLALILRKSISASNEQTCFKSILRLQAAHNLVVTQGGLRITRYWEFPRDDNHGASLEEAAQRIRELLEDSIRIRLRSDVPLGLTLSGGLDSSCVAILSQPHLTRTIETFTSVYGPTDFSEYPAAQRLAQSLQMNTNGVPCNAEGFIETLRKVVRHLETPHGSPAIIPYWEIMRAAKQKVTVLLEGQGADEVLAGYPLNFFPMALMDLLGRGKFREARSEYLLTKQEMAANPYAGLTLFFGWIIRALVPSMHGLVRVVRGDDGVYTGPLRIGRIPSSRPKRQKYTDWLNAGLAEATEVTLVDLLHYGDAISMAHGIESRVPFLDHRLVEYCFTLPGAFKYHQGFGKYILRKAVEDVVPSNIVWSRRKLGFVTPVSLWLRQNPQETVFPVLYSQRARQRGIFDHQQLDPIVRQHISGGRDMGNHIFRWLMTELWFEEFID